MKGYLAWLKGVIRSGWCAYTCGVAVLILGSVLLGVFVSPWWLAVTMPIGVLGTTYGLYRIGL